MPKRRKTGAEAKELFDRSIQRAEIARKVEYQSRKRRDKMTKLLDAWERKGKP